MSTSTDLKTKNRRTLLILAGVTLGMFGFGFALVPLYGLFCQVTGIQSLETRAALNTIKAPAPGAQATERWVTVKFNSVVHPDLPWAFKSTERKIRVHPGETHVVNFVAENRSSKAITGQALPSIAPWQATDFFNKMECFCFTQQTLKGNEVKDMPLRFVVSPDLPADISSLTLSYNFMRIADQPKIEKLAAN